MKKLFTLLVVSVMAIGLVACGNSNNVPNKTVSTFLDALKNGDLDKAISTLSEDTAEEFEYIYAYEDVFGETELSTEAKAAVDDLIQTTLKAACTDYKITDVSKVSDDSYTVKADITMMNYDDLDTSEFESTLEDKYGLTDEDIADLDETQIADLFVINIAKYSKELLEYCLENGTKEDVETTFGVIKVDGKWVIDTIQ